MADVIDDISHYCPVLLGDGCSVSSRFVDAEDQLAIHVELLLVDRRIADADGCRVTIAREVVERLFIEIVVAV